MGRPCLSALEAPGAQLLFSNAGGLYRSTDGGQTFSLVPGFNTEVSSLVATTVSNQTVLVAARNGYAYHNASGVLYSVDQGASWQTVLDNTTPLIKASNSTGLYPVSFAGKDDLNIKAAPGANGSLFVGVVTPPSSGSEEIGVFYTPRFMPSAGAPTWYNLGEPLLISSGGDCVLPGCTLEGNPQGENHFALIADPIQQGVAYIAGSGLLISRCRVSRRTTRSRRSCASTTTQPATRRHSRRSAFRAQPNRRIPIRVRWRSTRTAI